MISSFFSLNTLFLILFGIWTALTSRVGRRGICGNYYWLMLIGKNVGACVLIPIGLRMNVRNRGVARGLSFFIEDIMAYKNSIWTQAVGTL